MKINYDGILRYYLKLNNFCNMKCIYCIQGEDKPVLDCDNLPPAKKVAEYFPASGFYRIIFFGGEPFLNFDYMVDIAREVRKNNPNVIFYVTTNGTMLTKEKAEILNELDFVVTISHDGECYETTRRRKNILETNTEGIISIKNLAFVATLTNHNWDMYKVWDYFDEFRKKHNLPFFKVTFSDLKDCSGHTDEKLFVYENKGFENMLDRLFHNLKYQLVHGIYDAYEIRFMETTLGRILKEAQYHNTKSYCCSFDTDLTLDVYGNIYSCHNSCEVYGHITDEELKDYINPLVEEGECKNCFCKNLCMGGCWLSAKEKRKYNCYFQRQIYKRLFKMLDEIEPNFVENYLQRR